MKALVFVFLGLMLIGLFWGWNDYQQALVSPVVKQPVNIDIPKGASFNQVSAQLKLQIPFNPFWFKIIAYQRKLADKLQAGAYELKPGATLPDILQQMAEGRVHSYSVTFPEGWCFAEMLAQLEKTPDIKHLVHENGLDVTLQALGFKDMHAAEGWFFPDTYSYTKGMTDLAILKKAYQHQLEILEEEWAQRQADLPLASPYEALILASIVEKETAVASERPQIAGVFIRRLQKGMLLQTDPTVIYGMGKAYKGNIRRTDLTTATPYNTYMIAGLPPTPIAMPGKAAIHAVLHPAGGKSLYFVAKGNGHHVFSETLEAHVQAVKKYQLKS